MYGTFLFQGVVFEKDYPKFVEDVVKVLNKSVDERNNLFTKINSFYFEKINYKLPLK